jgi:hypothetical protein
MVSKWAIPLGTRLIPRARLVPYLQTRFEGKIHH